MNDIIIPETFHLLFYVGLMFAISQIFGNIASKIDLPKIIGYLTAGIIFGPYVTGLYSQNIIEHDLEFFRDLGHASS